MWRRTGVAIFVASATVRAPGQPLEPASPAAQPAPATMPAAVPATRPAVPLQPATPRDALKILAAAMRDGDTEKLQSVILTSNPAEARMLGAMAGLAGSLARLNQAAVKAFGEQDASRFTDDGTAHFSETLARIDAAEVAIDGDKATVRYQGDGEAPFEVRRTAAARAGQDAQWKVPMSELSPGADAAALDQRLGELNVQRKIVDELSDEIAAGKYKNAEASKEAWRSKIMQTLPSRPPGTLPAGAPTTGAARR